MDTAVENDTEKHQRRLHWIEKKLNEHIPITYWLPRYKIKEYIVPDLAAGFTLGCIHVPQALAMAHLAEANPSFGLYTSCFCAFFYAVYGTAVKSSFGPAAIASVLTNQAVSSYQGDLWTKADLVPLVTFLIGAYYLIAYICHFHVITVLFTKPMTLGFLTAAATQIILKTVKTILGIKIVEVRGVFNVIRNTYSTFKRIPETHLITMGISLCALIIFGLYHFGLKRILKNYPRVIIPIEAIVVLIAITISYFLELDMYGVSTVGKIQSGIMEPAIPEFGAFIYIFVPSLVLAVVGYSMCTTLILMYNDTVDIKQELLALALTNLICSFLHCMPFGNSVMRTAIAVSIGLKTLLTNMISSTLVLFVILFAGPIFEPLPTCILGCIIAFGISLMLFRSSKEVVKIFKNRIIEDIVIYLITYFTTLLVMVEIGLLVGFLMTLRQNLARQMKPKEGAEGPTQPGATNPPPAATAR